MRLVVSLCEKEKLPDENYEVVEGATLSRADLRPLAPSDLWIVLVVREWIAFIAAFRGNSIFSAEMGSLSVGRERASRYVLEINRSGHACTHARASSRPNWNSWSVIKRYILLALKRCVSLALNDPNEIPIDAFLFRLRSEPPTSPVSLFLSLSTTSSARSTTY